jgi:hypothetical protein
MKKIFFVMCLMLSAVMVSAQETKRVAILETVDRQGNVSYSHKLILRSNLAKAITNTPGYEAYDRTDIDAIMGEQDFQRTGLVSNDQIKRLGEMTGAKYVLVAEAVVVDASNMYITVKLLNVETAKLEITDNKMMGTNPVDIQKGCEALANTLFRQGNNQSSSKVSHGNQAQASKNANDGVIRISNNLYTYKGNSMNKREYEAFLRSTCPQAFKQYRQGKSIKIAGWTCFSIGLAFVVGGSALYALTKDYPTSPGIYYDPYYVGPTFTADPEVTGMKKAGIALLSVGAIATVTSIPLLTVGYIKQKRSVDTYNSQCKSSKPMAVNLTAGQNGLGLALQF